MDLELDPEHKHFARVLAAKQSMAQSILTASVRVNAAGLRKTENDKLGEILDRVKRLAG